MMIQSVLTLVAETPEAHGIFDTPTETGRDVFCSVKSVGSAEFWRAFANGLHPTVTFVLADSAEYAGEKICIHDSKRYRVIRTYVTPEQTIEITAEEATVDA